MAALVQTYPQQTTTVTTLQSRPSGNMIPAQAQANQQYMAAQQSQRNLSGSAVYRGSNAPIQPYAFTSTPSLNTNNQWQRYGNGYRTASSPAVPTQGLVQGHDIGRSRHAGSSSVPNAAYNHGMGTSKGGSRDDSGIPAARTNSQALRPQSAYLAGNTTPQMTFAQTSGTKTTPDRYRRPALQQQQQPRQTSTPSGSGMATVSHLYNAPGSNEQKSASVRGRNPSFQSRPNSYYGAVDDMQLNHQPSAEDSKRLRRRSMHSLDSADYPKPLTPQEFTHPEDSSRPDRVPTPKNSEKTLRIVSNLAPPGDNNMHVRNGSAESLTSSRSSHSRPSSSANRSVPTPTGNPSSSSTPSHLDDGSSKQDYPKLVNIPPRSSSSDAAKRQSTPSPLSKPVTMATDSSPQKPPSSLGSAPRQVLSQSTSASNNNNNASSPAAQHLAAINQKSTKSKSKTSRLRRAFSFGSAADFKKASGLEPTIDENAATDSSRLHKEPTAAEIYDAEQAAIAKKQEEGGIGNSIYGGRLFSSSTDNLSISSTASSASIMIRKMGRGMKKSTRNLVGLFRPKSVIGVPAADALAPEASQAAVSMVTVEAERVNVNADLNAQNGGGTGFPHLERNSLDISNTPSMVSERAGSSGTDSARRKSIVDGDKERAVVLAAVRKGILKHNRSGSPARDPRSNFDLPAIPNVADSPISTAPSTPNDDAQGHKRSGSVAIGNEDYFMTALRLRQDTKSAPGTPSGSAKRNATFSPRLVFHDTWPSGEYDRRGEIATCNLLTPILAQQIKEELNTFKMEMEVHENSKIYTHFF
ncbi:hypothetical protein CORC01_10030 [Colletotrichum orchidophilum]|uniref:Protein BNI4 n=1 Tax=Colletotrichum orchidophilum TaxID=1209926 RepID=A0A1G4AZN7_9PEZI|nr:uncharacterized protein CORC01_10030 [Colletotrichum orchidophilum]OHE94629.1 hypothetical protein CORC01_10030 [Colletotrichum orchidophilum]